MSKLAINKIIEEAQGRPKRPGPDPAEKKTVDTASTVDESSVEEVREVSRMETSVKEVQSTVCDESVESDTKRKSGDKKLCVTARFTEQEKTEFQKRVRDSGLQQGAFVKKALLNPTVDVKKIKIGDVEMLDRIAEVRIELREVNSQLKMIIDASAEQKKLHPEDWYHIIAIVLELEEARTRLSDLERRLLYGTH